MEAPWTFPLNRPSAPLGVQNAVLRARGRTHFVKDFPGPLSIKSVTAGTVAWKTGARELVVDRESFLVLHQGEPYSLEIDSREAVSTLCVFFEDGFVESLHGSLARAGIEPETVPAQFPRSLHPNDGRILPRLRAMAAHRSSGQALGGPTIPGTGA